MNRPQRPITRQEFFNYALNVGMNPTPLSQSAQQANLQALYTTIVISNPSTTSSPGQAPVWLGGSNLDPTTFNGLEIIPGTAAVITIDNERQLYEIQAPLVDTQCLTAEGIPFVAFDVSGIYLASTQAEFVGVLLFKTMFK